MTKWMPIESAPIGDVVIATDGDFVLTAYRHGGQWFGALHTNDGLISRLADFDPTHWKPMPSPPE